MCKKDQALVVKRSLSSANIASEARENDGTRANISTDEVINLDHGDPTAFESYWQKMGNKCTITFAGYQSLSYFSDIKNLCWFLEPKLEEEIKRLHNVVGNAVVNDYYIIVGTGSSQLIQAALYALSPVVDQPSPINVVSAAPYYSSYPEITDFLRSRLFKWGGDARSFDKDGAYIEFVTSPNNPNGAMQEAVVNNNGGDEGRVVHDLAYYWPQYTPITKPANYDIMLFTFSKCTGHAGSRIGWALVKDKDVAKKMTKFIEVNTIGVSKESQLRAAKILGVISDSCCKATVVESNSNNILNFFEHGQNLMTERWEKLRNVVKRNDQLFSLPKYPIQYCNFSKHFNEAHPAFAWLRYKGNVEEDCAKLFREHNILTRSGKRFGDDSSFVRISMLSRDEEFDIFIQRLSTIQGFTHDNFNA